MSLRRFVEQVRDWIECQRWMFSAEGRAYFEDVHRYGKEQAARFLTRRRLQEADRHFFEKTGMTYEEFDNARHEKGEA